MKITWKRLSLFLPITALMLFFSLSSSAETDLSGVSLIRDVMETGAAESQVHYPVFACEPGDHPLAPVIDSINRRILEKAQIPAYLQMLPAITEGSTGLQVDYECAYPQWFPDAHYVSFLISAQGKMLSGRPSQVYYPMTFDLLTGEEVTFEQLFTDPDGAKDWIETYMQDEIAPTLSNYLENADLLPVPYDRFFLDGQGNIVIVYENKQLSFLSGFSGAVAFRYSELWDYLDTSETGVPMQVMWHPNKYPFDAHLGEKNSEWLFNDALYGLGVGLYLNDPLEHVLDTFRSTTDSMSYPGGACYEVEEAVLRGTLILTDESEEIVTGILTSRVDHFGIETGKTALDDAIRLLAEDPLACLPISESAAELYRVCPGTAAIYYANDMEGNRLSFTLYADEAGIVQYIKLALEK